MNTSETFEGFEYNSTHLYKFIEVAGIFSLMLKNGNLVHFIPSNVVEFRNWLKEHAIENVRNDNTTM